MTVDEARELLLAKAANGHSSLPLAHLPFVHAYNHTLPLERKRLKRAMGTLLIAGKPWEQMMAALFLAAVGIPRGDESEVIRLYAETQATDESPLARVIIALSDRLRERDVRALENAFLANPVDNVNLAAVILRPESDEYLWAALMRVVGITESPDRLLSAFEAARNGHRVAEFMQTMADRPQPIVMAVASRLPVRWRLKLLEAAGVHHAK